MKVPMAKPGTSVKNKTGSWRTFKPVTDLSKCIYCGLCMLYCPEGIIRVDKEKKIKEVDYDYCKGCGICANVCPMKCIKMKKDEKV